MNIEAFCAERKSRLVSGVGRRARSRAFGCCKISFTKKASAESQASRVGPQGKRGVPARWTIQNWSATEVRLHSTDLPVGTTPVHSARLLLVRGTRHVMARQSWGKKQQTGPRCCKRGCLYSPTNMPLGGPPGGSPQARPGRPRSCGTLRGLHKNGAARFFT